MEDLSFREGQAKCISKEIPNFGMYAFKRLRLVNNSLSDEESALLIEAVANNGSVEAIEFAYNTVDKLSVKAMTLLLGASALRTIYLNNTQTSRAQLLELVSHLQQTQRHNLQHLALLH